MLMDKKFLFLYYDTDEEGYPNTDVDILSSVSDLMRKILPEGTTFMWLPRTISHSNFLTKEECIERLKIELAKLEGVSNE